MYQIFSATSVSFLCPFQEQRLVLSPTGYAAFYKPCENICIENASRVAPKSVYFEPICQIKQKFSTLPISAWDRGLLKNLHVSLQALEEWVTSSMSIALVVGVL